MSRIQPRDISPILQKFRNLLLGRELVSTLRFEGNNLSARTQPPPAVPSGPHHKLSANYYYTRDSRRTVEPPLLVAAGNKSGFLEGGSKDSQTSALATAKKPKTPGSVNLWDM